MTDDPAFWYVAEVNNPSHPMCAPNTLADADFAVLPPLRVDAIGPLPTFAVAPPFKLCGEPRYVSWREVHPVIVLVAMGTSR